MPSALDKSQKHCTDCPDYHPLSFSRDSSPGVSGQEGKLRISLKRDEATIGDSRGWMYFVTTFLAVSDGSAKASTYPNRSWLPQEGCSPLRTWSSIYEPDETCSHNKKMHQPCFPTTKTLCRVPGTSLLHVGYTVQRHYILSVNN